MTVNSCRKLTYLEELLDESAGLSLLVDLLFFGEKLEDVWALLPVVDGLLELHLALGVENVNSGNIGNETVSLKLVTELGSHERSGV